ncbi:Retrovirus-related Pol polyprotein from transposon TNT 1-94 [Grifola frondosa]|uniref:Retrovirus-related Pol polyprotein from transposon TNT 1-94 n=1 Tax=Grifola frondosa TaxID=5627 RepID=A0A1C7MSU6_GRIFR|nr:Retrovirus-related Pol polyprotein from transposon TNT 1-94 [Grifola frondosa]
MLSTAMITPMLVSLFAVVAAFSTSVCITIGMTILLALRAILARTGTLPLMGSWLMDFFAFSHYDVNYTSLWSTKAPSHAVGMKTLSRVRVDASAPEEPSTPATDAVKAEEDATSSSEESESAAGEDDDTDSLPDLVSVDDESDDDEDEDGTPSPPPSPSHAPAPSAASALRNVAPTTRAVPSQARIAPSRAPAPPPAPELHRSTHVRQAPVRDDDAKFRVSSYTRKASVQGIDPKSKGKAKVEESSSEEAQREEVEGQGGSAEVRDGVGAEHAKNASILDDPQSYEEAMSRPDAERWKAACAEELLTFVKAELYDEVERPRDRKVVGCKWVFRIKRGPDGEIEKYKARVVAKGFTQVEGVDYTDTFAPVTKFASIRALLALAAKLDLEIHQMDVKSAFLNGNLDEEIFMACPPGFQGARNIVWQLRKALYGLKQASREWYKKIRAEFESLGFTRSNADHSVFYKNEDGVLLIVAVYIDDMLIFCNSLPAVEALKADLGSHYDMTDLGEARRILNIKIIRDRARRTIELTQRQYVESILTHQGMADCRPVSTPMAQNLKLLKLSDAEIDATPYQSALGSLMYAMLGTRPDLAFAVGALSKHAAHPGEEHWTALMHVYKYLRATTDLRLVYDGNAKGEFPLCYVDANWASDVNDRRSVTGYVYIMSGAAISWSSKKQPSTALSSTEAEYMAMAGATKEALWLRTFLDEIQQLPAAATLLLVDNQSAMALAKNAAFHDRTKHIAVRHHFIRDELEEGHIRAEYVPTGDQVADVLTKALAREKHVRFTEGMGLH